MELKLNVYNDYDEIVKTYKKDSYLIKMGFLKKFIKTIDIEKLSKTLSAVNSFDNNIMTLSGIVFLISILFLFIKLFKYFFYYHNKK